MQHLARDLTDLLIALYELVRDSWPNTLILLVLLGEIALVALVSLEIVSAILLFARR